MTEDEETNRFYCHSCGLFFVVFNSLPYVTTERIEAFHV